MRFFTTFLLVTTNILLISIFLQLYTLNQQQKVVIQSLLSSPVANTVPSISPSVLAEHTQKANPTPTLTLIPTSNPTSIPKGKQWYVDVKGSDAATGLTVATAFKTIQKAVDIAMSGDTIHLAEGIYLQNMVTKRNGEVNFPITIQGSAGAVVKGASGGSGRIFEVNHNYITLDGFTIDGLFGNAQSESGYRDKLLYVLGKQSKSGVTGLKAIHMTFKNAGGECVRLRYFAKNNEIGYSTITNCGVADFKFDAGGKNGEGIYIGTAPEQRSDGKNPTSDPDESSSNWIHDNTFDTQGNECVDIKEASSGNIVENNKCTGQKDAESGGLDARGSNNIFRFNKVYANVGAGVRLGGDTSQDGVNNDVYQNKLNDNKNGGIKFQRKPQGKICGNTMSGNTGGNAVGTFASSFTPTKACP